MEITFVQKVADLLYKVILKHGSEIAQYFLDKSSQALNTLPMAEEFLSEIAEETKHVVAETEKTHETVYSVGYLKNPKPCTICHQQTMAAIIDYEHGKMLPSCPEHFGSTIGELHK